MKKEDVKNYIGMLLNNPTPNEEIINEIPNVIGLLSAYMAGLRGKDFPIENLIKEMDIEKEIPAPFHTLVAQSAIIKSKKIDSDIARDYVYKNIVKLFKEFKYFLTPNKA